MASLPVLAAYVALAVGSGLAAGFHVGGFPVSAVVVTGLVVAATLLRHRYLKARPKWRLMLTFLAVYASLALPLAYTLGNPPF